MKNLLKLSLITSMLLSTNLLAFDPSEQAVINQIGNNTFQNSTIIQSMEKSVNTSITDTFEDVTKAYYGDYQVSYEPSTDSEIATVTKKGLSEEIYGSYNYNHDLDSGTITKTKVDKGLLERVSDLESSGGSSVDLTQVNNDIYQNTTLATDAKNIAITAQDRANLNSSDITSIKDKNIAQDGVINQNVVNIADNKTAIQTTNLRVNTFDSRITTNNNLSQSNKTRLDNKDIKDSEQDKRLDALEKNNNADLEKTLMNERAITRKLINQGIAMNNAMNIPLDFTYSDKIIGVGVGAYNGEYALGTVMAWQYKNTTISVKAGIDGDKNVGASGSITIGF